MATPSKGNGCVGMSIVLAPYAAACGHFPATARSLLLSLASPITNRRPALQSGHCYQREAFQMLNPGFWWQATRRGWKSLSRAGIPRTHPYCLLTPAPGLEPMSFALGVLTWRNYGP